MILRRTLFSMASAIAFLSLLKAPSCDVIALTIQQQ